MGDGHVLTLPQPGWLMRLAHIRRVFFEGWEGDGERTFWQLQIVWGSALGPRWGTCAVSYLERGMVRCPRCRDDTNICGFLRLQILEKWANLSDPLNVQKPELFQLQAVFAPVTRGSATGSPLGGSPRPPLYTRVRHAPVPIWLQSLATPL